MSATRKRVDASHPPAPVLALAKTRKLPSIREWAEARPAVDPVLVARLRERRTA